jgi:phosphoglycolate phosphatase-like HAD superfamily hydrolase
VTPKWIIVFDWDGTLIESLPLKIQNAGQLFEENFCVRRAAVEAAYKIHSGIPRRQLFEAICADNGLPALTDDQFDSLSAEFTFRNQRSLSGMQVSVEVTFTLGTLRAKGYPLYVSTSAAPDEVQAIAESLVLSHYFEDILGSKNEFTKGLMHIEHILLQQPVGKGKIWFVGDEPNDVILGKQAGVRTVVKLGSHPRERLAAAEPDYIIENLSELIPLLERS